MAAASGKARRKRRKSSTGSKARGALWPWVAALAVVGGGIAISENMQTVRRWLPASWNLKHASAPVNSSGKDTSGPIPPANIPAPTTKPAGELAKVVPADLVGKSFSGTFYFCGTSGLDNCVVDGATFWFRKQQIRLADVSAPRTEDAACPQERSKGFAAKVRLRDLLNAGPFELTDWPNKNEDGAGRQLRVVMRNGSSIGQQLVREGVVHRVTEASKRWC